MRLRLERIDPAARAWRWYRLSVEPELFGGTLLVREWGRIGARGGGRQVEAHADEAAARAAMARWRRAKTRRGYVAIEPIPEAEPET